MKKATAMGGPCSNCPFRAQIRSPRSGWLYCLVTTALARAAFVMWFVCQSRRTSEPDTSVCPIVPVRLTVLVLPLMRTTNVTVSAAASTAFTA